MILKLFEAFLFVVDVTDLPVHLLPILLASAVDFLLLFRRQTFVDLLGDLELVSERNTLFHSVTVSLRIFVIFEGAGTTVLLPASDDDIAKGRGPRIGTIRLDGRKLPLFANVKFKFTSASFRGIGTTTAVVVEPLLDFL